MDKIYDAITKYYDTLFHTGYLPEKTVESLLVLDFVQCLLDDPDFVLMATCKQQQAACKLYECVTQNNCLL